MTTDAMGDLPSGLAAPARRALAAAGITRLTDLSSWTRADLAQLHGLGPNALGRLVDALAAEGLGLAGD